MKNRVHLDDIYSAIAFSEERFFNLNLKGFWKRIENYLSAIAYAEGGLHEEARSLLDIPPTCKIEDYTCFLRRNA